MIKTVGSRREGDQVGCVRKLAVSAIGGIVDENNDFCIEIRIDVAGLQSIDQIGIAIAIEIVRLQNLLADSSSAGALRRDRR